MAPWSGDWSKSARCESSSCVEVAKVKGLAAIRNSTDPAGAPSSALPFDYLTYPGRQGRKVKGDSSMASERDGQETERKEGGHTKVYLLIALLGAMGTFVGAVAALIAALR